MHGFPGSIGLALMCLLLMTGCNKSAGAETDDGGTAPDSPPAGQVDTGSDTQANAPADSEPGPEPETNTTPVDTVGLFAQLEGPLTFQSRQYFVGKSPAAYNASEPAGSLYLLHGLGASGCDFLDRYYPAQMVLDALARGYLVVLPETAQQSGTCRYENDAAPFRSGEIWLDSDLAYLDALHGEAILEAYPELADAPIFAGGMSAGGGVAPGFAQSAHRDLFAGVAVFSNNATAIAGLNPAQPYDVPTFFIYGENDNTTKDLSMVIDQMETLGVPWAFELNEAQPLTTTAFVTPLGISEAQSAVVAEALLADHRVADADGYLTSGSFDPYGGKVGAPTDPWEEALTDVFPPTASFREKEAILDVLRELDGAHFMPSEFNGAILDFFDASRTGGDLRDDTGQPTPCPIDPMEDNDDIVLGDALP
ncbi:MAG: alpha/beta hydrolase, partial [Myxococcota bacterium]|nr:alpha/beta hydrolase [Myxococcota bacterium]